MIDQRRHNRQGISENVTFRDTNGNSYEGKAKDISLGGMFIETTSTLPFGAPLEVRLTVTGTNPPDVLVLPAVSRWSSPVGMGIQFGLYGAKETHILAELSRRPESIPPR